MRWNWICENRRRSLRESLAISFFPPKDFGYGNRKRNEKVLKNGCFDYKTLEEIENLHEIK